MGLFDDPVGFFNGGTQGPFGQMLGGLFSGPGLQDFYDPNRSFAQNALDPRGIEQAMNIGAGFAMPIKAYHGSPYDFTKFDASKIGTGEGAQAYGHGLYFAESPQVARNYRDNLSNPVTKKIDPNSLDPQDIAVAFYRRAGQRAGAAHAERMAQDHPDQADAYMRAAEIIRSGDPYAGVSPGHMYEVNINAEPDQFLHWDKPLSEQPQSVQGALSPYRDLLTLRDPATGLPAPEYGEPVGAEIYHKIADKLGVPQGPNDLGGWRVGGPATSSDLSQRGIPGIRYLDQGSRIPENAVSQLPTGKWQVMPYWQEKYPQLAKPFESQDAALSALKATGTSNYVVFDPSIVEILKKYGLAGMTLGGGSAFMSGNQ